MVKMKPAKRSSQLGLILLIAALLIAIASVLILLFRTINGSKSKAADDSLIATMVATMYTTPTPANPVATLTPTSPPEQTETIEPSVQTTTEIPGATAAAGDRYTVAAGDTIDSIAANLNVTARQLRNANYLMGDTILVGQNLIIPDSSQSEDTLKWSFSAFGDDRSYSYPLEYDAPQYKLKYENFTIESVDPAAVANLVDHALINAETLFGSPLSGQFTAYATGTLFEPPNQYLKGRSYSSSREFIFLYDGSGDATDQQYIVAHEFTHLYMWNTYGIPSSVMLSEGSAVYSGMNAIAGSDHLPLMSMCKLLYDAGALPDISGDLSYEGHNYDQANYFTAGCFVEYLAETYGIQSIGTVYPTSAYQSVFGKNLSALENDFEVYLAGYPAVSGFSADEFAATMKKISLTYQNFFPNFAFTDKKIQEYLLIDQARIELLKGNISASNDKLAEYSQAATGG